MSEFKDYKRLGTAQCRPTTEAECNGAIAASISISEEDRLAGSPKDGDMIARNPNNYNDQWLIARDYFDANFGLTE